VQDQRYMIISMYIYTHFFTPAPEYQSNPDLCHELQARTLASAPQEKG
jgi:hypothetical protein